MKCIICGKEFNRNGREPLTCSPVCSRELYNKRNKKVAQNKPFVQNSKSL